MTAPLHPHSHVCSGIPVRLPNLGFEPWWILVLWPLAPSRSPSLRLPSPRPLLRPVLRAPAPLSRWAFQGPAPSLAVQSTEKRGGRCCDSHSCRPDRAGWGLSEAPVPALLTPGSAGLGPVAGHCRGWPFPGLRNSGWSRLPGALPWGLWVPGAGLAPSFSFVYAGWQKSSGLLAGSGSSLCYIPFPWSHCGLGWRARELVRGWAFSAPGLVCHAPLVPRQQQGGRGDSSSPWGQPRSWPTACSAALPSLSRPGQLIPPRAFLPPQLRTF